MTQGSQQQQLGKHSSAASRLSGAIEGQSLAIGLVCAYKSRWCAPMGRARECSTRIHIASSTEAREAHVSGVGDVIETISE